MTAPEDRGEAAPWWVTAIILTVCAAGTLAWVAWATLVLWPALVRLVVEHTGLVLWSAAGLFLTLFVAGLASSGRQERALAAEVRAIRADLGAPCGCQACRATELARRGDR